jgi:hypothetical protein
MTAFISEAASVLPEDEFTVTRTVPVWAVVKLKMLDQLP